MLVDVWFGILGMDKVAPTVFSMSFIYHIEKGFWAENFPFSLIQVLCLEVFLCE